MVAAIVVDQIGRVGGHEARPLSRHEPFHIGCPGGIAAEQAIITQYPEIAGPGERLGGQLGNLIGIDQADRFAEQLGKLFGVKAQQGQVEVCGGELGDLRE